MSQGRKGSTSTNNTRHASTKPPRATGTSAQSASATPVYFGMDPGVKTYWDHLPEEQRTEVLSLSVKQLRERANTHHMVSGRPVLMQLLEASLARLGDRSTWTQWQWNEQAPCFETAHAFRMHVREDRVPDSLQKYLQTDTFSTRQAQQALNKCMQRVQKQLAALKAQILQQERAAPWRQQKRSALICAIFKAIEAEHPYLFHAFATYVVYGIKQLLPDNRCVMKEPVEDREFHLALEDLEKLQPSQLNSVTCWLEKQVSDMCRLAASPDATEEEYAARPFHITNHGSTLAVTSQWIRQLEAHEEQTATSIGDSEGSLLDWLYSTIAGVAPRMNMPGCCKPPYRISLLWVWVQQQQQLNTLVALSLSYQPQLDMLANSATKSQSADRALQLLVNTLKDVAEWEVRLHSCRDLLQLLERNKEIRKCMESKFNFRPRNFKAGQDPQELLPEAVLCLLCEETELIKVKAQHLSYLIHQAEMHLALANRQSSQAASEHEFLESQRNFYIDRVGGPEQWPDWFKNNLADPRNSTDMNPIAESAYFHTEAHEMAAKKRDLHAQAEEKAREIVGLQQQRDQLLPWSCDLDDLHSTFRGHASSMKAAERKVAAKNNTANAAMLQKVYQSYMKSLKQFQKVTWPKLTTPEQSHTLYEAMKQQLKSVVKTFQAGCAVLPLMEAQVVHAASDNPGAVVLPHLILPMLRERLEAKADAALKGSRSAPNSGRTGKPAQAGTSNLTAGPSVRELQASFSKVLHTSTDRPMKREEIDRGLYCISAVQMARLDEKKSCLYGAYADDLLLETIYIRPKKTLEENSLVNTFMGDMGPFGQTLAAAFCAGL